MSSDRPAEASPSPGEEEWLGRLQAVAEACVRQSLRYWRVEWVDAVQEVVLRVLDKEDEAPPRGSERYWGWVYTVATRRAIDIRRYLERRRAAALPDDLRGPYAPAWAGSVFTDAERACIEATIEGAVPQHAQAWRLRYEADPLQNATQIGAALAVKPDLVRKWLESLRKRIRKNCLHRFDDKGERISGG